MIQEKWAEKFVKETSNIIKSNICLTNRRGQVIASSDPQCLGESNSAALMAIERNLPIEVEAENLAFWNMRYPAIIMPIEYQGQLYGAIIVEGNPNDIRMHVRLIKVNAEYIIAQDNERKDDYSQLLSRTQMLSHILFSENKELNKYNRSHFKSLLNLDKPFVVAIICTQTSSKTKLKNIHNTLENWSIPKDDMIQISPQEYVFIFKANKHRGETVKDIHHYINNNSNSAFKSHTLVTIGTFEKDIQGLILSFQHAKTLQSLLCDTGTLSGIFNYEDYELKAICYKMKDVVPPNQNMLISTYEKVIHSGEDNYLGETLEVFFKNHGKLIKTANDLFIHRNTLNYRLKKIHDITKWDPNTIDGMILLRIAQILHSYHQ
ncbi:sugar diacid recognition domain-containing protein [Staphylococcus canis]|uniref:Sugar diacid utilization regulator n=1 Tax=Staphylococcus canis TaxID=2724942 RepID=A0ABS0TB92_9STAP|nr:sugar diacid recognition domain-containing protein [Staphylococcus canis]MBI5976028.1 sugar diacid utilization regulator [Staphylococcus canis]